MTDSRVLLGIMLMFTAQAIHSVTATPLRIGAFNLHIFGASKYADNSTVAIISRVSQFKYS